MNITVMGAGNSGLATAAHLSMEGHSVTLWNRSEETIKELLETKTIHCEGVIEGSCTIHAVTADIEVAVSDPDLILITTPATAHRELAELIQEYQKIHLDSVNRACLFGLGIQGSANGFNQSTRRQLRRQTIIYTSPKRALMR